MLTGSRRLCGTYSSWRVPICVILTLWFRRVLEYVKSKSRSTAKCQRHVQPQELSKVTFRLSLRNWFIYHRLLTTVCKNRFYSATLTSVAMNFSHQVPLSIPGVTRTNCSRTTVGLLSAADKLFFSERVINVWNYVPYDIVCFLRV